MDPEFFPMVLWGDRGEDTCSFDKEELLLKFFLRLGEKTICIEKFTIFGY
jgi:hypothetical protein